MFATERSIFADPHVSVGLVAGDGGALLWPKLIGHMRAKRYLLTGDHVEAADAAAMGLITRCVADETELATVVSEMATRLRNGASHAIRFTKTSVNAGLRQTASAVIDRAASFEAITMMTDDHRIALEAFLAKKPPNFSGR